MAEQGAVGAAAQRTDLLGRPIQERMPLDLWLNELAVLAGYDSGEALVSFTGSDCWMESYNDGLTPAEAWQEDCANG